jgi:hypothetical protein
MPAELAQSLPQKAHGRLNPTRRCCSGFAKGRSRQARKRAEKRAKRRSAPLLFEKRIFAWPFNVLMQSSGLENTVRQGGCFGDGMKSS